MSGPVISRELNEELKPRPQADTWLGGFTNSILEQLKQSQSEDPTMGMVMGAKIPGGAKAAREGSEYILELAEKSGLDENARKAVRWAQDRYPRLVGHATAIRLKPPSGGPIERLRDFFGMGGGDFTSMGRHTGEIRLANNQSLGEAMDSIAHELQHLRDKMRLGENFDPNYNWFDLKNYFKPEFIPEASARRTGEIGRNIGLRQEMTGNLRPRASGVKPVRPREKKF